QESADGRFIYYRKRGGLWRLPVSGGLENQVIESVNQLNTSIPVKNGVFFVAPSVAAGKESLDSKICFYDAITRQVRDVVTVPGPLGWGLSLSPDRRKFLITRLKTGGSDLRFISHP